MSQINDPVPLMLQLAKMAKIEESNIRRMVLVLDVGCIPTLFVETFLEKTNEELVPTELAVSNEPIVVNTTTMQNEQFHTKVPIPQVER